MATPPQDILDYNTVVDDVQQGLIDMEDTIFSVIGQYAQCDAKDVFPSNPDLSEGEIIVHEYHTPSTETRGWRMNINKTSAQRS